MGRVTVIGRSGTGKSYKAGELLESVVPDFEIAVHFDIEDEEKGLSDPDHDPLYGTLYVDRELAAKIDWIKCLWNHKKLRIVPDGLTTDEMRELYARICDAVMKLCDNRNGPADNAFVSCDEAHNIVTQANFPKPVERMITGGRKYGVECLHITQRPQLLHTTVISQADIRFYFGVSDDNDIKKIDKSSNFSADLLNDLPSRVCVIENKNTGEFKIVVTDPNVDLPEKYHRMDVPVEVDPTDRQRPHYSGDDGLVDNAVPV